MKKIRYSKPIIRIKKITIPFFFTIQSFDWAEDLLASCYGCGSGACGCGGSCHTTGPPSDTECY